jgi:propionyl-CoA synthetase
MPDQLKGHVPFALVTLAASREAQNLSSNELLRAVNEQIREGEKRISQGCFTTHVTSQSSWFADVGAIATITAVVKGRLPKTRSG